MTFQIDMSPLTQSSMNVGRAISGVGQVIGDRLEKNRQQQEQKEMEELLSSAHSGDTEAIRQVFSKNPEMGVFLQKQEEERQSKYGTEQKKIVDDANFGYAKQFKFAGTPEEKEAIKMRAIQDPSSDLFDEDDLDSPLEELEFDSNLVLYNQVGAKGFEKLVSDEDEKGESTANVKDFNHYKNLKTTDPEAAEQFALLSGITKEGDSPIKPTTAMQNFEKWQVMPEGEDKNAFAKVIGITPKDTVKSAQDKIERVQAKKQEIESATLMKEKVADFLANPDFIGSVTGATSRLPAVFEGSVDAEGAFDSLKDSLTMENLDKMSGVLTDRDIALLANAASALRYGMSENQLKIEMKKINDAMDRTIKKASEGIPILSITAEVDEVMVDNESLSDSAKKYL